MEINWIKMHKGISKAFCAQIMLISVSSAKLRQVELDSIIAWSDLIVIANVINRSEAYAEMRVDSAIKGNQAPESIILKWKPEVHDQGIKQPGYYLLYLRRDKNGEISGAAYGRSYWRVFLQTSQESKNNGFIKFEYPLTSIKISAESQLIQNISCCEKSWSGEKKQKGLYLKDVLQYIKEKTRRK